MTAEVTFAKGFLSSLDSRPVKLQADYAADQKTIQPKGAYTLPRMPQPMKALERQSAPGSGPSTDVHIKSSRGPPINIQLTLQSLNTSILELKQKVAVEAGLDGTDKIRLLHNKKPCSDSKSIKEVIGDESIGRVEFSVMFIGITPHASSQAGPTEAGDDADSLRKRARAVLDTDEFWMDLEGYLRQKLDGAPMAQGAARLFRDTWNEKGKSL